MDNAVKLDIQGIKCDHCDYKNEDVKFEDYKEWLNKPCPKCGENLLTEEDYNSTLMLIEITKAVNELIPKDMQSDDEKASMEVKMNGTGNIEFGKINKER